MPAKPANWPGKCELEVRTLILPSHRSWLVQWIVHEYWSCCTSFSELLAIASFLDINWRPFKNIKNGSQHSFLLSQGAINTLSHRLLHLNLTLDRQRKAKWNFKHKNSSGDLCLRILSQHKSFRNFSNEALMTWYGMPRVVVHVAVMELTMMIFFPSSDWCDGDALCLHRPSSNVSASSDATAHARPQH